ncbi:MAG: hypothetical protein K6B15_10205 [Parasporobacterium sp.]|nr:hypothetical protein [Parasporobacterium sp.]
MKRSFEPLPIYKFVLLLVVIALTISVIIISVLLYDKSKKNMYGTEATETPIAFKVIEPKEKVELISLSISLKDVNTVFYSDSEISKDLFRVIGTYSDKTEEELTEYDIEVPKLLVGENIIVFVYDKLRTEFIINVDERVDDTWIDGTTAIDNPSPDWLLNIAATSYANQIIVVAGYDMNNAIVSMHENVDGYWRQIVKSNGYIGLYGMGSANKDMAVTPIGTFTIDKAFGIADNPGCGMEYTKVDDSYWWSGDPNNHFNELVSDREEPDFDKSDSEHIYDYWTQYQYCLNMGYNSEGIYENGSAFFLHCSNEYPYTLGCVAVPENIMIIIMQNIRPGCVIVIDTIDNLGAY